MLADFLYGLLIVTTVLAVFGIFRIVRRIRRTSGAPTERLLVLTLVMLGGLTILFFFLSGQLDNYRSANGEVRKTDQQLFVEKIYPPLAESQTLLDYQLKQLTTLQERIYELSRDHPQQSSRLQFAYNTWKYERQGLTKLKARADRAVRVAMGVHSVSDKSYIESAFTQEAVDWEKVISDRLNEYHDSQLKVTNSMIDNVILQNKNLSQLRQNKNTLATSNRTSLKSGFDAKTVKPLIEYLENTESGLAESLTQLEGEVTNATQKRRQARNYALENPDLEPVFRKVIDGWLQLENKGVYFRDQLLHAVQAEYLAVLLGANKKDPQVVRLKKLVSQLAQTLYEDLVSSRKVLEKSYRIAPR